uniref:ATP synthase epsilon chain, chloroplastic n=1 Tax=Phegopteris aurita TaxID=173912 RepID=A0A248REZ1_9MONI|nr:ATP synthase CF1 epsilon subunit [Pseudophegopteris aurita]ASU96007.1 ATP synthase CF1 epsilon subunit [Pseudophegopteris aurita]QKV46209.1 CF1 subunit epsilon [Phegopteris decursive-pinnata]
MVLNLRVMAPNRIVWNSEVWEIASSTNSGQIGILPNHAPLLTALDMGVSKIRHDGQWSAMALMGGFAMIDNNRVTILVNEAERATEIDPDEARRTSQMAQADSAKAEGKKRVIEANLAFKRAKARLEASNAA